MNGESIDDLFARYGPAYKWLATVTAMLGGMTAILASSTVNVAFPDIMGAFGIGRDQAQLLSTGYFASMTAGMLLYGWLVKSLGERLSYSLALIVFACGTAMSGLAQNPETLMLGRVMQGTAAGVVQPLGMAITFSVFPKGKKGLSMGIYSMGMVLAPSLGPTMGGLAIDLFNWRYVFLLTLPTVALAFVLGNLFMPTRPLPKVLPKFDFLGFALLCASLLGLLLGSSYGQRLGWHSGEIQSLFAVGILSGVGFVMRQIYGASPLVNLALFTNPQFTAAAAISFFTGCAFLSSTFLIPLFVQQIQQYSALEAGLLMMPGGISLLILFPLAGRMADMFPPHVLIYIGLLSFGLAFVFLASADVNTPFWTFVGYTILIRAGTAFTRPVTNSAALQSLPAHLLQQGSGAVNFMRQLGAALGTNALVVFLEFRIPFYGDAFTATQTGRASASGELLDQVADLLRQAGVPESVRDPGALHYLGNVIYAQASTLGYRDTFMALALVAFCGAVPAWVMWRTNVRAKRAEAAGGPAVAPAE